MKFFISLILGASLFFIGCGKKETVEETAKSNDKLTIKLSMVFKPSELVTQEIEKVTERINKRSKGTIDIQVFHSGQLPVYKDSLEQVVSGSDWIAVEDPSYVGDYIPDFAALVGPMLYNSYEEYEAMIDTDYVKGLKKQAEEKGIKIIALDYLFGFRNLITNKKIENPNDLKGLKIRVPNSQLWMKTLDAMGANPSPISFTETYAAIQQGVVDGLEGSIATMYGTKIYEVTKNMSVTKHFLGTAGVYISPKLWEKMSVKQQQIVMEEFQNGAIENNKELRKIDKEYKDKLEKEGVVFNEVDSEAFNDSTANVFNQFPTWTPGVHKTLMNELKKIREK
ncbi:MAG: C4-dicarboxylate TRAP transporter substrate-binding protein [Psychrilyobacter sp.]|uniref:C4-dicarboxylate TRAP transporter substrate-binding protein n=1 Tax=Psychrilyobacter sp. TaxID=2586924 RepID=UPI003C771DBE